MTPVFVHWSNGNDYASLMGFVADRVWRRKKDFGQGTAMAVVDAGRVIAAVIFHNYDEDAGVVEISAASDSKRWLTRAVLLAMFGYAFNDLKCQAVVARVDGKNNTLARLFERYGFDRYDIPRLRGRNTSESVLVLSDDAWKENGFHGERDYG